MNEFELKKEYGEFIPTYFKWMSLDNQKDIVDRLEKSTKRTKKNGLNVD